jgi:type 1 fimbria pilin
MLVKTPAIKLGVEVRDATTQDGKIVLTGVATAMPCTIEIGGAEAWRLLGRLLRPSVLMLMLRAAFSGES